MPILLDSLFYSIETGNTKNQNASIRKIILDSFINVLKSKYPVYTFLQPINYQPEKIDELSACIVGNKYAENEITIIFDFDCFSCINADSIVQRIFHQYKDKMKFRFVYYSDYIDKTVVACDAAAIQGKYLEMHNLIIENTLEMNDSLMISFASKLGLNMNDFLKDYNDESNFKKHLRNKQILNNMGIYSVPCFFINDKYIVDVPTFEYAISELKL